MGGGAKPQVAMAEGGFEVEDDTYIWVPRVSGI